MFPTGYCNCGSKIRCSIETFDHERYVRIACTMTEGDKECGRRQLRQPFRAELANELQHGSVFAYRNAKAAEMIESGDKSLYRLYGADVLRTAKHELRKSQYLDKDPIKALAILKRKTTSGQSTIHNIGLDPFHVHFWSGHQNRIYNSKVNKKAWVIVDATGSLSRKIVHIDGRNSKHLFLYTAVLQTEAGPIPVCRQVTESHDAVSISNWLKEWTKSGAKFPAEVVNILINILLLLQESK